jgi:hypothetical protein
MSKPTPCSIVKDLRDNNKEAHEYVETVNDLLLAYCKTPEYCDSTPYQREQLHKRCTDIKDLLKGISKLNETEYLEECAA